MLIRHSHVVPKLRTQEALAFLLVSFEVVMLNWTQKYSYIHIRLHYLFNLLFLLHYSVFSPSLVSSFLPLPLIHSFLVTYFLQFLIFPLLICPSFINTFTSVFFSISLLFVMKAFPNPATQLCSIDYSSARNYYYIATLRVIYRSTKSFSMVRIKIMC
jgi:hypothetical protein